MRATARISLILNQVAWLFYQHLFVVDNVYALCGVVNLSACKVENALYFFAGAFHFIDSGFYLNA